MNQYLRGIALSLLASCIAGCYPNSDNLIQHVANNQQVSDEATRWRRSFGERQLEQLLSDRPEMRGILPEDHAVYRWLVDSFEKERIGERIYWIADEPSTGEKAEHASRYSGYPAYIVITADLKASPIDKWTMLVFEMFNIENTESFRLLSNLGLAGKIDGDTYARKCVELEFNAACKTRIFFRETPLPNPDVSRDVFYHWLVSEDTALQNHEQLWDSDEAYLEDSNYRHFRKHYDQMIAPHVALIGSGNP